jgi:hypothetical protein
MYIPLTFEGSQAKCLFATGGYEGYFISGSQQYKYHWFTGSANLEVQKGTIDNVQIYVVGGGGGAATYIASSGGGGGGGGAVTYTMNGRLFQGTYSVSVGAGGTGGPAESTPGTNGSPSSFIGNNLNMIAGGGQGGGQGVNLGTGGAAGGEGGGAGGAGGSSSGANGGYGTTIYFASEGAQGYGCGGGGASSVFNGNDGDGGCNDAGTGGPTGAAPGGAGTNRYGVGGGGGNGPGYQLGGPGGSGSVMIQYPIYDYCSNYFNETGSCGCRQITFDTTYDLNYYPYRTGSYIYMPCGGNNFVSGSLIAYAPLTVCAVSNSYFSQAKPAANEAFTTITAGFVNSGAECVSASLVPVACSPEAFPATCTSSIVTIQTPTASVGNPSTFGYVAKNETTHSIYTSTENRVKYICISTGSLYNNNERYPKVFVAGTGPVLYNTASCNTITILAGGGRGKIYLCNGAEQTLIAPTAGTQYCIDTTIGVKPVTGFSLFNYSIGGSCLSGSFDTGSCGCP